MPTRVQAELNIPVPLLANVTAPVGVKPVPGAVSVTVAVQVVVWPSVTVEGMQFTVVAVLRRLMVRVAVPELAVWVESPL